MSEPFFSTVCFPRSSLSDEWKCVCPASEREREDRTIYCPSFAERKWCDERMMAWAFCKCSKKCTRGMHHCSSSCVRATWNKTHRDAVLQLSFNLCKRLPLQSSVFWQKQFCAVFRQPLTMRKVFRQPLWLRKFFWTVHNGVSTINIILINWP